MPFIADFHIHSKYSRATSPEMNIPTVSKWAAIKGINLMGTGDFTHPDWLKELESNLKEIEYGIFQHEGIFWMLTAEVSNIYFKAGRSRKIHNIVFAPSFSIVKEINKALSEHGDLASDGRPMLDLDAEKMAKIFSGINPDIFIIPSHAWTPWFSIFGSNSGFDRVEDCFGAETSRILALETGLSADPPMNWRLSGLDRYSLTSNSDSHSPSKIGREANVFKNKFGYKELMEILRTKDKERFLYTIEFFPEEGKYHWDGHRKCEVRLPPKEAKNLNYRCPKCGGKLTIGVMHRVEVLADRPEGFIPENAIPYKNVVSLDEIIADALGIGKDSVGVQREYNLITKKMGSEFSILLEKPENELLENLPPKIARGIINMRKGKVEINPGYDGVYGEVKISAASEEAPEKQLELF